MVASLPTRSTEDHRPRSALPNRSRGFPNGFHQLGACLTSTRPEPAQTIAEHSPLTRVIDDDFGLHDDGDQGEFRAPQELLHELTERLLKAADAGVGDEHGDAERHLCGFRPHELERFVPDLHRKISRLKIGDHGAVAVQRGDVEVRDSDCAAAVATHAYEATIPTHEQPGHRRSCQSHLMPPVRGSIAPPWLNCARRICFERVFAAAINPGPVSV